MQEATEQEKITQLRKKEQRGTGKNGPQKKKIKINDENTLGIIITKDPKKIRFMFLN